MLCSSCSFRLFEPLASGAPSLCASTGKVKNQGQGSLRTARASAGRSLSSHASSRASRCQCPRGPCTNPCGGCAASRCKPSTCAEHLGCCHSFIVTKEAAVNVLVHHLRVSLGRILRSRATERLQTGSRGLAYCSCFLRALPTGGVSNLWAFAICQACGSLFRVSLRIFSELEGSFPILLLMAYLYFFWPIFLLGC